MKKWLGVLLGIGAPLMGYEGVLYAPAEPCSWWLSAEFLYWKAFEGGTEYADKFKSLEASVASALAETRGKELNFDCAPGFRIEGGYLNQNCCWDVGLSYTYYYTRAKESTSGTLFPTYNYFGSVAGGDAAIVDNADAKWKVQFQYIDLDFGSAVWFGCSLALHPHLGLRGGWINQHARADYSGIGIPSVDVSLKNDFWGVGLKGGVDARLHLIGSLSLFSNLAASVLYGHFDVRNRIVQDSVPQIDLHETLRRLSPTVQMAFGIAWERPLSCWRYPMLCSLSAAAEAQYWWRQNQMQRFTSGTFPIHVNPEPDLGLFGLTLRGTLYF
jgi:hypothetical protein